MPAPAAVTDLTLTQTTTGDPLGTLEWDHDGTDLDRFMLGFKRAQDTEWTNLDPRPKADFGVGPYEATVPLTTNIEWRVIPMSVDGLVPS